MPAAASTSSNDATPIAMQDDPETASHTGRTQRTLERLAVLVVKATPDHFRVPTAPSPAITATLHSGGGEKVGSAQYGLSPLGDRVYVHDIHVAAEHRRCGYATAFLWHLTRQHTQPITPVRELHAATGFWENARALASEAMVVTEAVWDLDAEAGRWAHLCPDAVRLEGQILERLYIAHEPWAVAVGRELDEGSGTAERCDRQSSS